MRSAGHHPVEPRSDNLCAETFLGTESRLGHLQERSPCTLAISGLVQNGIAPVLDFAGVTLNARSRAIRKPGFPSDLD